MRYHLSFLSTWTCICQMKKRLLRMHLEHKISMVKQQCGQWHSGIRWQSRQRSFVPALRVDAGKELLSQGPQSGPVALPAFWAPCHDSVAAYRLHLLQYPDTPNPLGLFTKGILHQWHKFLYPTFSYCSVPPFLNRLQWRNAPKCD